MHSFLVITETGASTGFKCAGFDCMEAEADGDVGALLTGLQAGGRYGLIAVEERLLSRVPENVMRRLRKRGLPIIIHINMPLKWAEMEFGESPVVRLIRRAIGYQIKIKR